MDNRSGVINQISHSEILCLRFSRKASKRSLTMQKGAGKEPFWYNNATSFTFQFNTPIAREVVRSRDMEHKITDLQGNERRSCLAVSKINSLCPPPQSQAARNQINCTSASSAAAAVIDDDDMRASSTDPS